MRHGSGVVAVYNEKLILQSLLDFGYPLEEARQFANDGCWEVQVPGKTNFSYFPMDLLLPFQREVLGLEQEKPNHYDDMEQIYQAVHGLLGRLLEEFHQCADGILSDDPPVSYTHLDVYKRQSSLWAISFIVGSFPFSFCRASFACIAL